MNKKLIVLINSFAILAPALALGAGAFTAPGGNLSLTGVIGAMLIVIWLVFAGFAILMFVVTGFLFLSAQGNTDQLKTAKNSFIWGVIGVVAAVVAYSIVAIIKDSMLGGG